jgi:hypothetical protein
MSYLLKFQQK